MQHLPIHQQDYLDIIFAHKNKEYGAYQAHKQYHKRILIAISVMLGIVASLSLFAFFSKGESTLINVAKKPLETIMDTRSVIIEKEEIKPKPDIIHRQKESPKVNTKKFTTDIKIVDNDMAKKEDKLSQPKANELASNKDERGNDATTQLQQEEKKGEEITIKEEIKPEKVIEPVKPTRTADKMPEYPGGKEALIRYLSSHLKYPIQAVEAGISGKVVLEFVVNEEGAISNIKVIKGLSMGCTEEAIRVVKAMKHWTPGIKNGKPIPVYFMLPIEFALAN